MYEYTLKKIINKDKLTSEIFLGVFARDEIPSKINKLPACFILNTHVRAKPGQHWLAIYINENGHCEFFDSYGRPPKYYKLDLYLRKLKLSKYTYNKQPIQGDSQYCGLYCLLYLLFRVRQKSNQFFNKFTSNLNKNDLFLTNTLKNASK